jgi:hypothetical protein
MGDVPTSEIVKRRFGPGFPKPCHTSTVVECAYWECQVADRCMGLSAPEKPTPFAAGEGR